MNKENTYKNGIPKGLCQCGCGWAAPLYLNDNKKKGYKRGESRPFIAGHDIRMRWREKGLGADQKLYKIIVDEFYEEQFVATSADDGPYRMVTPGGYVTLYRVDHPNANNGKIPEHRLIMAESLNRPLFDKETVHHINGKRKDNRLENLELWSSSHPSGQRIQDKVAWALKIIMDYPKIVEEFLPNEDTPLEEIYLGP